MSDVRGERQASGPDLGQPERSDSNQGIPAEWNVSWAGAATALCALLITHAESM